MNGFSRRLDRQHGSGCPFIPMHGRSRMRWINLRLPTGAQRRAIDRKHHSRFTLRPCSIVECLAQGVHQVRALI